MDDNNLDSRRFGVRKFDWPERKSTSLSWNSWGVVAISMVVLVVVILQFSGHNPLPVESEIAEEIEYREVITEKGQRTRLRLNDGSTVQLNSESRLSIPVLFSEDTLRLVHLEGEAYFEVTHDEERQFVVQTDGTVTKVLGTKFNIRSYSFEEQVTVAVVEGAVSLGAQEADAYMSKTIMHNQVGILSPMGTAHISDVPDISEYLAWINGELVFNQDSLATVKKKLEQWYGIVIELDFDENNKLEKKIKGNFFRQTECERSFRVNLPGAGL